MALFNGCDSIGDECVFNMELSVVIPAYNEEKRLGRTFDVIIEFLQRTKREWEIVVHDDGSTDGTASLVHRYADKHPAVRLNPGGANHGKGYAVKHGMLAARGQWRLLTDADLSTPMEEFNKLWPWTQQGFEVVIGSRKIKGAQVEVRQPFLRQKMGLVYSYASKWFLATPVMDFTCGFKLFRGDVAQAVFSRSLIERWGYDSEVLFLAHRLGFKIKEVPVVWRNDTATKVRLGTDMLSSATELLQIRRNALAGKYQLNSPMSPKR
jgi:glycosyltransferase involved in cell wall biosynthesis